MCGKGDQFKVATLLCRSAGYKSGIQMFPMRSPDDMENTGCGAYCGADSINRIQLMCPDNATFASDCEIINTVVCDSFNDLVLKCLDYDPSPTPPDFTRQFLKLKKKRFIPQF